MTGSKLRRRAIKRSRSTARRLRNRLGRMIRAVIDFATPVRALLIVALAIGLLGAVAFDHPVLQIGGVAIASLVIFALLAQLSRRMDRVGFGTAAAPAPAWPAGSLRRAIGTSPAIVSVVIPGKNEAAYARDCIRSLKNQTLTNFDAIIVDDGSTDSTLDVVLDEIGDDPRFKVIRLARSVGPGLARNMGVARSSAEYVTFLDLDDFLAPDSLAARVGLAEGHADLPWVAGAYCWHETVDVESTPEQWLPPIATPRETISWLSHFDDGPFINSAPLVRRDAFLAIGGFDEATTAEDMILWFKLLRWGFTLVPSPTVGVAYRRKPTSYAASTSVAMRDTITRLLEERSEPMAAPRAEHGPFFFPEDLGRYRSAVGYTRRTAAALGIAIADGSPDAVIKGLVGDLRSVPFPLVGWGVEIRDRARAGSKRITRPRGEMARDPAIVREIERLVGPVVADARRNAAKWLEAKEQPPLPQRGIARPVRAPKLLPVSPRSLRSLTRSGRPFLLLPSSAYHTDELIELAEELQRRGFAPVAMLNERRWATTGSALARVDVPAVRSLPPDDWLLDFDGLLTFNDWGEYFGEYVRYVKGHDTVSFAKVEGVQDWLDHDTGMDRKAYLTADVVLCQGDNDVNALQGRRGGLEVIGSDRLEAIWTGPLPADGRPRVVGNVNFTYGVQSEHRALWVETLRDACRRAGVPLDLSLHPSEVAKYPGLTATQPIRHLMVTNSILVSRFSTVLFEGMARGCSVIYYNPHGEQVPTFHHPDGAFDVAEDPQTLARFIESAKTRTRAKAKERAAGFFAHQVSMIPGASVATRTMDAIERNLAADANRRSAAS
jgi:glycosyltransferase involved in cell wall biosynthesis